MAETEGTKPAPRAGERRQATVMFADISGFTSMSEKLDHEEVTSIMNACFEELGGVITEHGGTIDKFIGDCIMAVYGVPKAIEQAPRRAVESALAMRERLYRFNEEQELVIPLDIHIGINSGEVLAGQVGAGQKSEFTVMGDAVNLASRLEDASETGQILVGPLTFRYTRTDFRFNPLKPLSVKGKEQPVQVYEVVAESGKGAVRGVSAGSGESNVMGRPAEIAPAAGAEAAERIIQSELVGREEERIRLEQQITKLLNGQGAIVHIIGEAGLGKSRLCTEVLSGSFMDKATMLEGRALSTGRNLSYYPIIEIINRWASIDDDDREEQAFTKLEAAIHTVAPQQSDEIVPFVATLMRLTLHGQHAERMENVSRDSLATLIAKQLRDLLIAASKFRPLVLIVEDLHWADASTLEMLRAIVPVSNEHPVLFLFNFRPGYIESSGALHTDMVQHHPQICIDIEVKPLTAEQSSRLAENLLRNKGIPKKTTELIIERSGGNPFFIEEVVRAFIDLGYLQPTYSGFIATAELEDATIPNSINEVIMARVDNLDHQKRSLLRVASVIGRSFFYRILTDLMTTRKELDESVEDSLTALKQLQFIRERMRLAEVEYLFKHALAQEAVYNSILVKERKELHLATAQAIEKNFSDRLQEFYGVLALHFMRGEGFEKAEVYLEKAGNAALNSSASSEALTYYQQAVKIYQEKQGKNASPERIAMLEKNVALAYWRKGDNVEAINHCDRALRYLGYEKGSVAQTFDAVFGVISFLRWLYLPKIGKERQPESKDLLFIDINYIRSWLYSLIDSTQFTIVMFGLMKRALHFSETLLKTRFYIVSDISLALSVLGLFGNVVERIYSKTYVLAENKYQDYLNNNAELWLHYTFGFKDPTYKKEVFRYFVKIGDFQRANLYAAYWADIFRSRGDFNKAFEIINELKQIADDYRNSASLTLYYEGMTNTHYVQGEYDQALHCSQHLIKSALELGQKSLHKTYLACQLRALIGLGKLNEAQTGIEKLKHLLTEEKVFSPLQTAPVYITLTAYYCSRADALQGGRLTSELKRESIPYLRPMLKYSARNMQRYPEACRVAGTWYWQTGRPRQAKKWWKRGIKKATEMKIELEKLNIYYEIGRRMSEKNERKPLSRFEGMPSEHYLQLAKEGFERKGVKT